MIGRTIAHYQILEKLGEGGMGVVYKARDTHLDRFVAIKVLPPERVADPERKRRFVQEAKAASALNHPNIITIHDIASEGGRDFIAMEYVEGQPLDRLIAGRGLPLKEALDYAVQMASALAAAHAAGIVHRDVKPPNIMVARAPSGPCQVKVLDFGLAKLTERGAPSETASTLTATEQGVVLGTVAYMSPEQAEGKLVDARSDVFSFGAVLYEMLSGRRPFQGDSQFSTLMAIVRDSPPPLKTIRAGVPAELERILHRCLEKDRQARYPSARELSKELAACQARLTAPPVDLRSILRRARFVLPALAFLLVLAALATWFGVRSYRMRWAHNQALPEIARLIETEDFIAAFRLARQVERHIPDDPQLRRLKRDSSAAVSIRTTPPGADVYWKGYLAVDAGWELLGKSPLERVTVPRGDHRWRITKQGFDPVERVFWGGGPHSFSLEPQGTGPPGMVRIPGGVFQFRSAPPVKLEDHWLDRYEVTNKQFKQFVDGGGYQKREYWKQPFVEDGRVLAWEEAAGRFRDATGRPGPSTWELGTYPEGRAQYPVSGVSWYEAAAYAQFAGKSLPTVYHWYNAAGLGFSSDILRLSNFGGEGPAPLGSRQGLGLFGTYDMAGNVREWCWNQTGSKRYILGGSWSDPSYMFQDEYALSPFDRSANNGFRCATYTAPPAEGLTAPVKTLIRDFSKEKPASDEVFRVYRSIYSYDRTELEARLESVDEASPHWRKEKITFNAAYGNERVIAYLFLPRNAAPPYQTVVYFPGASAFYQKSSAGLEPGGLDFILRSGRALLYPVYKASYERGQGLLVDWGDLGPNVKKDLIVWWSKDLGRSIDYLETRTDIDSTRLAYYGLSAGAMVAPIMTAIEGRFKASVLVAGGWFFDRVPPEADGIHFAPRARMPVLMLNGRLDFVFPVETSQLPMLRLLGAPDKDKRHVLFDAGHGLPRIPVIREVLDWLDRYLGPVRCSA